MKFLPRFGVVFLILGSLLPAMNASAQAADTRCARILYDSASTEEAEAPLGQLNAIFLANLIGHFAGFQAILQPVTSYEAGELERCRANFYLGSRFNQLLPKAFLSDLARTRNTVVWMKNSIWKLGPKETSRLFGIRYLRTSGLDHERKDPDGEPGFFREIRYRGEVFRKFGRFASADPRSYVASPDLVEVEPEPKDPEVTILAEAIHSSRGRTVPYAVRKENRYFVADLPFSFIHESDRYLVLADLLFDVLGESPLYPRRRPAVFRIEDVSSFTDQKLLRELGDFLKENRVPFLVSLIPIFRDPAAATRLDSRGQGLPMHEDSRLMRTLKQLREAGATFVWHGVTHQYGHGLSGEGYEFWDSAEDRPILEDSGDYLLKKFDQGWKVLKKAGLQPLIWETPHYRASVLDHEIFARLFPWTIGRPNYAVHRVTGEALPAPSPALWYWGSGESAARDRLRTLQVETRGKIEGQFFPYEIYGDIYGQRVIPENLGFPAVSGSPTLADLAKTVRRNRVIRDSWASLFLHVQYLSSRPATWRSELRQLIAEARASGHEFIDLEPFLITRNMLRSKPIIQIQERTLKWKKKSS